MATILVSFVGKGSYNECNYVFGEKQCRTHLFMFALANFYSGEIDAVRILHTEESANAKREDDDKTYIEQLRELHSANGLPAPEPVLIQSGKSEDELWEMFDTISSLFNENDEVIFDITHAFRSMPIISLLVTALLRETKNIKLKALVYGAFDAKDNEGNVPVFDLTSFVEMLDWVSATKQFKTTGNAKLLVELLDRKDKSLASDIENLSQSLRLLRPVTVMEQAQRVQKKITSEKNQQFIRSKPIFQLLQSIDESYSRFALIKPKEKKEEFIRKLAELARWYLEKGQHVQSLAIIRELLPTLICYKRNLNFFKYENNRQIAENYLNQRDETNKTAGDRQSYDWNDTGLPNHLKKIWKKITQTRNDVLHAGFNENSQSAGDLIKENQKLVEYVENTLRIFRFRQ